MNLENTLRTKIIRAIPSAIAPRKPYHIQLITEPSEPIEDMQETLEETVIRLRSNPSYGVKDIITDAKCERQDEGLVCELDLAMGRMVVCVSNSRKKLNRLMKRFGRSRRMLVQGVIAQIGSAKAHFRTQFLNCVRTGKMFFVNKPDPEEERQRRKIREKRARWNAPKNFQPGFA
jgi:hypothetical protein